MKIQWFPGHIKKAINDIKEIINSVDIILYMVDARCPRSCIDEAFFKENTNKKCLVVISKSDLIDKSDYHLVSDTIEKYNKDYIFLDNKSNDLYKKVNNKIDEMLSHITKKYEEKNVKNYAYKSIVVGVPNVGKSTFINTYVKKKINKTEDKAGVTKKISLTKISNHMYIYDTPCVTMPKFDDENIGENLAIIGSINDDIVDNVELSYVLLKYLYTYYPRCLKERYGIDINIQNIDDIHNIALSICESKKIYKKGNIEDIDKMSRMVIDDFRKGKLGKIYLERK